VAAVPKEKMNKGKWSASLKKTTSSKKQKSTTTDTQIGIGKRVKIKREQLYHILATQSQRDCHPHGVPLDFNYFGTVVSGGGSKTAKKGWDISFNILPVEDNIVLNITRSKLTLVAPGEDETATPSTQQECLDKIEEEEEEV